MHTHRHACGPAHTHTHRRRHISMGIISMGIISMDLIQRSPSREGADSGCLRHQQAHVQGLRLVQATHTPGMRRGGGQSWSLYSMHAQKHMAACTRYVCAAAKASHLTQLMAHSSSWGGRGTASGAPLHPSSTEGARDGRKTAVLLLSLLESSPLAWTRVPRRTLRDAYCTSRTACRCPASTHCPQEGGGCKLGPTCTTSLSVSQ